MTPGLQNPANRAENLIRLCSACAFYLFIRQPHGSEVSPAARNTLDSARIPRASKLLICGLFQKGRVLAQDGAEFWHRTGGRRSFSTNLGTHPYFASLLPRRTPLRISTEPFAEYRETSSVGRVLPWFADGPLLASSPRRKSSGVSKAIAIWALSFTRLEANRNLLTAMSLLPKSIHRCRRYPTKFNSGRDIPPKRL